MNSVLTREVHSRRDTLLKLLPFAGIYAVYLIGLGLDVMDVDAAQYASMAREMLDTGNYLQLYNRGIDYLDKPPLIFWLSALSFKLLGVSNFAYKLPSFLFSVAGAYATYRLAKLYYTREVGYLSALIVASCQAFFLFNHDVRTDTNLAGAVILAVWQLAEYLRNGRWLNFFLGFTGVALAMLAKGPIGLMVPVLAFATDFAVKRQWSAFFRWQWLAGIVWVGILLLPMCIGLYQQYGTEGLRFYFWTQSFGRLTGENVWKNDADMFFFMHTFMWAFLPWSLLFVVAFFRETRELISRKFRIRSTEEALMWGGFLLPYIALTTSKYQLPHYIFVVFPLAAIITGKYLYQLLTNEANKIAVRVWERVQLGVAGIVWLVIALLITVSFPLQNIFLWIIILAMAGLSVYAYVAGRSSVSRLVLPSLITIIGANFALNAHVYPVLFTYQSPTVAARYMREENVDLDRVVIYTQEAHMHSMDFYVRRIIPLAKTPDEFAALPAGLTYQVFTTAEGLAELQQLGYSPEIVKTFDHFHISMLTLPFLNPNTRDQAIKKRHILRVSR
jgi:4-amino-4-deoxy-L-arabinose transferase-like glycosyltransferase